MVAAHTAKSVSDYNGEDKINKGMKVLIQYWKSYYSHSLFKKNVELETCACLPQSMEFHKNVISNYYFY